MKLVAIATSLERSQNERQFDDCLPYVSSNRETWVKIGLGHSEIICPKGGPLKVRKKHK